MNKKLKTIGLILSGVVLAALLYYAYGKYYEAVYNKGYNEAIELANLYADLTNQLVSLCKESPAECGAVIAETVSEKPKMGYR